MRTGKWDATKTFMTEALSDATILDAIGSPWSASAAPPRAPPAVLQATSFAAYWKKDVNGREAVHRFRGHRVRRCERRVPRRAAGLLGFAREDQDAT